MSLLNYLQPQKIDDLADEFYDHRLSDDNIELDDQIDEVSLENFWDKVVEDIHEDPEWFSFDNK
ncbi:MAG: hypothetical protein WCQ49_00160 [Candidatus Saccharibacteria bacterium]